VGRGRHNGRGKRDGGGTGWCTGEGSLVGLAVGAIKVELHICPRIRRM
jgi:hypothetical protein